MSLRTLEKFGESSSEAAQIAKLILSAFCDDSAEANKFWIDAVARCLWTKEIWGDRDRAERVAAGLILRVKYTEDALKAAGVSLSD